ncbi:hypothetical protein D3C80_1807330 [compost metagenome]
MGYLPSFEGRDLTGTLHRQINYFGPPPPSVIGPICPGSQTLPEMGVILVSNCSYAAITPFRFNFLGISLIKCIKVGSVRQIIMVQPLKEVSHWRVFSLVANQNNGVTA